VRGFSRVLGWSLCNDIPSLFNETARTIWNPQLFAVQIENTRFPLVFLKRKIKKIENRDFTAVSPSLRPTPSTTNYSTSVFPTRTDPSPTPSKHT
jgi:hypothetical protein